MPVSGAALSGSIGAAFSGFAIKKPDFKLSFLNSQMSRNNLRVSRRLERDLERVFIEVISTGRTRTPSHCAQVPSVRRGDNRLELLMPRKIRFRTLDLEMTARRT